MPKRAILAALLLLASGEAAAARVTLGRYGRWLALRETAAARCFAVTRPVSAMRGGQPFLSFATGRGFGSRPRLRLRLSRTSAGNATAVVGGSSFPLIVQGEAFGVDRHGDPRIVAAVRAARRLDVRATDLRGRRFVDIYPLTGAPSAIDAATLGCLPR